MGSKSCMVVEVRLEAGLVLAPPPALTGPKPLLQGPSPLLPWLVHLPLLARAVSRLKKYLQLLLAPKILGPSPLDQNRPVLNLLGQSHPSPRIPDEGPDLREQGLDHPTRDLGPLADRDLRLGQDLHLDQDLQVGQGPRVDQGHL